MVERHAIFQFRLVTNRSVRVQNIRRLEKRWKFFLQVAPIRAKFRVVLQIKIVDYQLNVGNFTGVVGFAVENFFGRRQIFSADTGELEHFKNLDGAFVQQALEPFGGEVRKTQRVMNNLGVDINVRLPRTQMNRRLNRNRHFKFCHAAATSGT